MTPEKELTPGHATPSGTARYRDRFAGELPGHFREAHHLWLSSIGLGTYLGRPDGATDELYRGALTRALELGANVIDTAVNYRHQRSERAIGQTLGDLIESGALRRDEVFVATKGGFLSFDGEEPPDPDAYFRERFLDTGLARPDDVAAGCHVMSPEYVADQIEVSRRNLGLKTIDLYYLHNPETQLERGTRDGFYTRLRRAFEVLEGAVKSGKICAYGTATWNAYRLQPAAPEAVSLMEVLKAAEDVGGPAHHFRAVQLPFNLAMLEALDPAMQVMEGKPAPALVAARSRGLMVFSSASLLQGRLTEGLPPEIAQHFAGLGTDAQRAIQFVRSTPGVTSALVGMSRLEHVEENLATARVAPMSFKDYRAMFGGGVPEAGGEPRHADG
ncbi:MAG TPA: aldo/keto reductase [Terriglobia bacterium]|jgi:aryl-alcohol dehydrogenase-like predicted oxidoreductase|nr:aldo/keto reductase [Terriglobia bacterium]